MSKTQTLFDSRFSSRFSTKDYFLQVTGGPHQGLEFPINQEMVRIGRTDLCDLSLDEDRWVSTIHCECWLDEHGFRVRDTDSRNGILVNGCQVLDAYLPEGTEFKIGSSTLLVKSNQQNREITVSYNDASETLVGKSSRMRKLFSILPRLAQRKVNTLLTGETGTGKSTVARAIHLQGPRSEQPFVSVNCGAIPPSLIESVLFGHEKGAFTGADSRHHGLFEQANQGTLFLDEIAELPLDLQPKLLDVLERKKFRRLGGHEEIEVDFHLLSATLRDLALEVAEKRFREDLYFRLAVVELEVPPLRERMEDLSLLTERMLRELSNDPYLSFSKKALQKMEKYLWPGNIRELRNTLERTLVFLEGDVIEAHEIILSNEDAALLPPSDTPPTEVSDGPAWGGMFPKPLSSNNPPISLKQATEVLEREMIEQALEETQRSVQDSAVLLDVSVPWLYARIRKFGLKTKNKKRNG